MKLFIKNTVIFLLISIFISIIAFTLLSLSHHLQGRTNIMSTTGGFGASLSRYRDPLMQGNIDVLFCGSSHCYRGFDPRIFKTVGISSFNLGSSAQTPLNTFYLIKDIAPKIKSNKIVMEVYWVTLQNKGVESAIDLISNTPLTNNNLKMALMTYSIEPLKTWYYSKFHRLKFPLEKEQLLPSKYDSYIPGGFVETARDTNRFYMKKVEDKITLQSFNQLVYLDSIYNYCQENKVELILINTPVYKMVIESISNYDEKLEEIKLFASARNLQFIDFNNDENYQSGNWNPAVDWYDDTHLTQRGVMKFNNLFISKYGSLLKD